jgi:hypothetical protein
MGQVNEQERAGVGGPCAWAMSVRSASDPNMKMSWVYENSTVSRQPLINAVHRISENEE